MMERYAALNNERQQLLAEVEDMMVERNTTNDLVGGTSDG